MRFDKKKDKFDSKVLVYIKKLGTRYKEFYLCFMNSFCHRSYNNQIQSGLLTIALALVFMQTGLIIKDSTVGFAPLFIVLNLLSFIGCWLIFSFLIARFTFYKIAVLTTLLLASALADHYIKITNNPITVPLLILFWLGIVQLIVPQFFKKYKVGILSVYGLVISYYLFLFLTTPDYGLEDRGSFANFMLVPIPVFAVLWVYEQWRWLKTLKIDKGKAELALLKSQINPHFFFNTLNNLYGLVVEKSDDAPEVVLKLSDMMRYTIYEGKEDTVQLKDEVNYLENYIELHKIRYQKKVEIEFLHDIKANMRIAPLLFIILLENAFKHGVEKMRKNAFIRLQMKSEGNQLCFNIENSFNQLAVHESNGIGLENLKKRLEHLYPRKYTLKIEKKATTYKVQLNLKLA